ncbi:MAG: helix-turn-helix domain-containing protein, partial [Planctomycetota bacterium]
TEEDLPLAQAEAFALVSELHRRHHRRRALAAAPWLDRARELLASDAHSVAAVASACGLGLSAFRAQFRRATGVSPLRWRIRRRMRRAQHLLLAGRPLAQVAQQLGYPSVQGFSRQFGQWTGLPPGRWLARQEESSGG